MMPDKARSFGEGNDGAVRNRGSIDLVLEQGHAAISINNPARRNALSLALWRGLSEAVERACTDPTVRLISLRGAAGTFVSGADISEFETHRATAEQAEAYEAVNAASYAAVREAPVPTLAVIEGFCFGGGLGLAAACDLRLASETARFAIPAARLGLAYPRESLADLVSLVGPAAAKRLLFTAEPIDAREALRIGLINAVAKPEDFAGLIETEIASLLARAPLTQRAAKSAVRALTDPTVDEKASREASVCFSSNDYQEGRRAFLEKRSPVFTGG